LRGGKVSDARARLGLEANRLTVLVAGGSQGAHAINEAVACALPWLDRKAERVQFVHLAGAHDEQFVRESYEKNGITGKVMSFCNQMELAYSAADVVVARSGASTLTEIASFGLPSILIPYPQAAGNHQWHNARVFESAGAARLLDQSEFGSLHVERGERLANAITELLDDETGRVRMAEAARLLAVDDAAERLAQLLEQYAQ
jgi:UDP-N-acetylglucosamine--N-acetylmuramyl-(pentapeptide) pyrophosphoryl-undecaprenol N-acetylglucosamine transferase